MSHRTLRVVLGLCALVVAGCEASHSGSSSRSEIDRQTGVGVTVEPMTPIPPPKPLSLEELMSRGNAADKAGDPFVALAFYREAERRHPGNPDVAFAMLVLAVETGQREVAEQAHADLLRRAPAAANDPEVKALRAKAEAMPKRPDHFVNAMATAEQLLFDFGQNGDPELARRARRLVNDYTWNPANNDPVLWRNAGMVAMALRLENLAVHAINRLQKSPAQHRKLVAELRSLDARNYQVVDPSQVRFSREWIGRSPSSHLPARDLAALLDGTTTLEWLEELLLFGTVVPFDEDSAWRLCARKLDERGEYHKSDLLWFAALGGMDGSIDRDKLAVASNSEWGALAHDDLYMLFFPDVHLTLASGTALHINRADVAARLAQDLTIMSYRGSVEAEERVRLGVTRKLHSAPVDLQLGERIRVRSLKYGLDTMVDSVTRYPSLIEDGILILVMRSNSVFLFDLPGKPADRSAMSAYVELFTTRLEAFLANGEFDRATKDMDMAKRNRLRQKVRDAAGGYAHHMAVAYHNGEGGPRDRAEAIRWFRRSAEFGYQNAMKALEELNR